MTDQKFNPRRRFRRFAVADVPGSLAFASEVKIVNLSLSGCAVTTSVPLPTGKKFAVTIGPPRDGLEFQATVCWSRLAEDSLLEPGQPSMYRSGLVFADILTERAQRLLAFMEDTVELTVDRQLFGRLEIAGRALANLETDFRFTVETLSSGGLGVLIDQPLAAGDEFEIELNLGGTPFTSLVRVVSVELAEGEASYRMGMEFLDTEPQQMEILSTFLRFQFESSTPH